MAISLLKKFNYSELDNKYVFLLNSNILNITFSSTTAISLYIHNGKIDIVSQLSTIDREDANKCIKGNEFVIIQCTAVDYYSPSKYFIKTAHRNMDVCSILLEEVPELFFKQLEEDKKALQL